MAEPHPLPRQSLPPLPPGTGVERALRVMPGLILASCAVAAAFEIRQFSQILLFSPMILAFALGIGFQNTVGTPAWAKPGIAFALKRVLRFAVCLLGLQLTFQQVAAVGISGIGVIAVALIATFAVTKLLGRWMGIDPKLTELIAAGTSICGASAVIATNAVTEAPDEDVAYAVACVTIFGSIAMTMYPFLFSVLKLTPRAYGLWAGASIHEIAQVVGAAFAEGKEAGEFGTTAKLSRVIMLAPAVAVLSIISLRSRRRSPLGTLRCMPIPYFVLGFLALAGVNSAFAIPTDVKPRITLATTFLLSLALAAMGLETDLRKVKGKGGRPLVLGALSSVFIALISLALIKLTA